MNVGVRRSPPEAELFYRHVTIDDKDVCWPWKGYTDKVGYGKFHGEKNTLAHRVSYELNVGPIPPGMTIDHVRARGCTMKSCVNPSHLESVTHLENIKRVPVATHCRKGHEFTRENTRKTSRQKVCITCARTATRLCMRALYARRKAERSGGVA